MQTHVARVSPETRCPECDGNLRWDGELVCESCSVVLESSPIDHGPEWGYIDDADEGLPRCGPQRTPRLHDAGLSTRIGVKSDFEKLSPSKRRQLRRQNRYHKRAQAPTKTERNKRDLIGEIRRIASSIDIHGDALDRACTLGTTAADESILQGRNIDAIAAAAVHIGARQARVYRRVDSIAEVAHCPDSELRTAVTTIQVELSVEVPPLTPTEVLPALFDGLPGEVPEEIRLTAVELANTVEQSPDVRGSPSGLAGGVVHVVDDRKRWTQREIGEAADIVTTTVRENAAKIKSAQFSATVLQSESSDSPEKTSA